MKAGALALLVAAPALAGCALDDECRDGFPLALKGYPSVSSPGAYEFQSTLWNCTDAPIPLDEPCDARNGIVPRVVIDNVTLHLTLGVGPAIPRDAIECLEGPPRDAAEPGAFLEQRYHWDGRYAIGNETRAAPNGTYVIFVWAGSHHASVRVSAPW